jgi:hypothetical protein
LISSSGNSNQLTRYNAKLEEKGSMTLTSRHPLAKLSLLLFAAGIVIITYAAAYVFFRVRGHTNYESQTKVDKFFEAVHQYAQPLIFICAVGIVVSALGYVIYDSFWK